MTQSSDQPAPTTDTETDDVIARPGDTIRAKWTMDGAATLQDAAERLEGYARHLRELHDLGWTLTGPIEDDYGHLRDPNGDAGWLDDDD